MCDAVPLDHHTELQEQSIALLQAVGWQGIAMVEYRFDPQTGRAVLMEINGRYWGSYPLAMQSGANFALISFYLENQLGMPHLPVLRDDLRCRMVVTEIKRLVRIVLQPHRIADRSFKINPVAEVTRFLGDFLRPRVHYYVWAAKDPSPFIADFRNMVRKLWNK